MEERLTVYHNTGLLHVGNPRDESWRPVNNTGANQQKSNYGEDEMKHRIAQNTRLM
jgi:hypothetical protein